MKSSATKQRVRLTPNNQPSGNSYSAQNFPAINFVIGRQNAYIIPASLRLNGTFTLKNNAGVQIANENNAAGSATNGASLNNSIGTSSCFDEVNLSTLNGRNLETIRSYSRYLAGSKPLMNSSMDINNGLGLSDPMMTNKSLTNSRTANVEHDFSVPLSVGLFDSNRLLNVSEKGFHGLNIDILLAQNSQVVQPYFIYENSTPGGKTARSATQTYNYEVKNLSLTFDVLRPDEALFRSLPSSGVLSYQTVSTLHATLLSSDQTITMRFGASNVLSVTHSCTPSLHINNINVDSFQLCQPQTNVPNTGDGTVAKVKTVSYQRAGVLFPYNFMLDNTLQADVGVVPLGNGSPQAQIMNPYLNSVSLYDNNNNKLNPQSNIGLNTANQLAGYHGLPFSTAPDPKSVWGLGTPMDSNKQGVSFRDREYAVRIQSELDDTTANAFFTFTRVRNLAEYSPTGINVVE